PPQSLMPSPTFADSSNLQEARNIRAIKPSARTETPRLALKWSRPRGGVREAGTCSLGKSYSTIQRRNNTYTTKCPELTHLTGPRLIGGPVFQPCNLLRRYLRSPAPSAGARSPSRATAIPLCRKPRAPQQDCPPSR